MSTEHAPALYLACMSTQGRKNQEKIYAEAVELREQNIATRMRFFGETRAEAEAVLPPVPPLKPMVDMLPPTADSQAVNVEPERREYVHERWQKRTVGKMLEPYGGILGFRGALEKAARIDPETSAKAWKDAPIWVQHARRIEAALTKLRIEGVELWGERVMPDEWRGQRWKRGNRCKAHRVRGESHRGRAPARPVMERLWSIMEGLRGLYGVRYALAAQADVSGNTLDLLWRRKPCSALSAQAILKAIEVLAATGYRVRSRVVQLPELTFEKGVAA